MKYLKALPSTVAMALVVLLVTNVNGARPGTDGDSGGKGAVTPAEAPKKEKKKIKLADNKNHQEIKPGEYAVDSKGNTISNDGPGSIFVDTNPSGEITGIDLGSSGNAHFHSVTSNPVSVTTAGGSLSITSGGPMTVTVTANGGGSVSFGPFNGQPPNGSKVIMNSASSGGATINLVLDQNATFQNNGVPNNTYILPNGTVKT